VRIDSVTRRIEVPMFLIEPNREPEPRRAPAAEPRESRMPLSRPPAAPRSWWGTVPGQLSILVMVGAAIFIVLTLTGITPR
jgi:hypothetical protein